MARAYMKLDGNLVAVLLDAKVVPEPTGENYVRFVSAEARTITPKYTNSGITLQYSVNGGKTWVTIASGDLTTSATRYGKNKIAIFL